LHFEFLFIDDLNLSTLFIETKESKAVFKTNLEHLDESETVKYNK
jgi:hypothetical protein